MFFVKLNKNDYVIVGISSLSESEILVKVVCVCVCMLFEKNVRRKRQREKGSVSEYNRCVICSNNT